MDATQTRDCARNPPIRWVVERRAAVPLRMGVPHHLCGRQHLVHRDGNRESVCGALPGDGLAWAGYGGTGVPLAGRTLKVVSACQQRVCGNRSHESSVTQLLVTKEVMEFIMRLPWFPWWLRWQHY